jgi:hypothetical protein
MKLMTEEELLKYIDNQPNLIDDEVKKRDEFFKKLNCLRCSNTKVIPILYISKLFSKTNVLPNYLAKCLACNTEWEPLTGIEIKIPKY